MAACCARCTAVAVKQTLTLADQEQGLSSGLAAGTSKGAPWGARVQERDKKQAGTYLS